MHKSCRLSLFVLKMKYKQTAAYILSSVLKETKYPVSQNPSFLTAPLENKTMHTYFATSTLIFRAAITYFNFWFI